MRQMPLIVLVVAAGLAADAAAQIVPPIPDRTPPSEPYTPPPPPATPPAPTPREPPKPEEPLPSIIQRDADGKLLPLAGAKPITALRAFTFDEETWGKLNPVIDAYFGSIDRIVVDKLDLVTNVREQTSRLDEIKDFGALFELTQSIRELPPSDLLDRAQQSGAITPAQKRRVEKVVTDWDNAYKQNLQQSYGPDDALTITLVFGRSIYIERTREYVESLERQIRELAPRLGELLERIDLDDATLDRARGMDRSGVGAAEVARQVFFEVLDTDARKALLLAARPELGEAPKSDG